MAALETSLNRALELSPGTAEQLARLAGNVFAIECTAPPVTVHVRPESRGVRLAGYYEGPVTTRVRGRLSDFYDLAMAEDPAAALINGEVSVAGDSAPLLELQKILASLDIDWEAPLTQALGDVAGHQAAGLIRGALTWGRTTSASLTRQMAEYIQEEARLTPTALELEDFYHDVQSLQMRVERLAARIKRAAGKAGRRG